MNKLFSLVFAVALNIAAAAAAHTMPVDRFDLKPGQPDNHGS